MNFLKIIGREDELFQKDILKHNHSLSEVISKSSFLVIGGAGSIGQSVTKEIFKRNPKVLHVVDLSENNMVELVRDIRSTLGYIDGEFKTFAIDCGNSEFKALTQSESYDYVFNLSALKHVRSEKDPYTLMRMLEVNIFNTIKTLSLTKNNNSKRYFCVSTDKAANPVNMMGASKKIMEIFIMRESLEHSISMARFANVAFSDGSLLHGFNQRFSKKQPFSAPNDIKRYFITPQESGELCLLSGLLGNNRDIFFPKLNKELDLIKFSDLAIRYLDELGYTPYECDTEEEARAKSEELIDKKLWPCYFFKSDTTGEKYVEEFYTDSEDIDWDQFETIGVIKNKPNYDEKALEKFQNAIKTLRARTHWTKDEIINEFNDLLPDFKHQETGKNLDQKM